MPMSIHRVKPIVSRFHMNSMNSCSHFSSCCKRSDKKLNATSSQITENKGQGPSQAMLYATGLTPENINLPQIGVASMWFEGNPCNMHLLKLSEHVAAGVRKANLNAFRFNTIGVSDGISNGTEGMRYSLPSRDLIADSIETIMNGQLYDGLIAIPGCDKNMPGSLMAMARLNRPSIMVYGGSIKPGCCPSEPNKPLDIVNVFTSYAKLIEKEISDSKFDEIVQHAIPGPGACGGMYTANTMAIMAETMGMSLPGSSSFMAESNEKLEECEMAGRAMHRLLELDLKPRDIITSKSIHNAMVMLMIMGGSTNAVLHLIAIAKSANIELNLDAFAEISKKTPVLADMMPSGTYRMIDVFQQVGGTPSILKFLLDQNMIYGDTMTVTGSTLEQNLRNTKTLDFSAQKVIRPLDAPIKPTGHICILKGNLAPKGAVSKLTGYEGTRFVGKAVVFESETQFARAIESGEIQRRSTERLVIVIRYEGPKGGPGMPEMLKPTTLIKGAGLADRCALITDGRFSGGSSGFVIGHVTPEAYEGGPIAFVENNDIITIDGDKCEISFEVSDQELELRRARWQRPAPKFDVGVLGRYIRNVGDASGGCTLD